MAIHWTALECQEERSLIEAAQDGDLDAFSALAKRHIPWLRGLARRRLGPYLDDADDAVQETLIRACGAMPRFGQEFKFAAWLRRILLNVCTDMILARNRQGALCERLAAQTVDTEQQELPLVDPAIQEAVNQALASLPETHRRAIVLRDLEERSYADVAESMAITEANARARVHRARVALQRSLGALAGSLAAIGAPIRWARVAQHSLTLRLANKSPGAVPLANGADAAKLPVAGTPTMSGTASQFLLQLSASPLPQVVSAAAPEAARSSLPAVAAIASLAVAGAGALPGVAQSVLPQAAAAAPAISVPAPSDVTPAPGAGNPFSGSQNGAQTISAAGIPARPANAWTWMATAKGGSVDPAAPQATSNATSGSAGKTGPLGTATANGPQTGNQGPSQGPGALPATAAPAAGGPACPWPSTFSGVPDSGVTLPPPIFDSAQASAFYSTGEIMLSTSGPLSIGSAPGTMSDGSGLSVFNTVVGVCLPGDATTQTVVANIESSTGESLQLRGAYASTGSGLDQTDELYRGVAVILETTGQGTTDGGGLPFVARISLGPAGAVSMQVAFFGPLPPQWNEAATGAATASGGAPPGGPGPPLQSGAGGSPATTDPSTTSLSASDPGQGLSTPAP
ncbi:MAG: sigma-70 family RNA polymerase sigma factor [Acidimicrobiales bacterium]